MQTSETARYKVQQLKQLPALSITVSRLLSMLSNADLEIDDLAKVIEQDPPLTARIIGLANAAYFSPPRPISSVTEAIIRVLGLQMVKTLALSIALCGAFDTSRCPGFRLDEYWFRAFASAQLARNLVMQMNAKQRLDPDEIYLTALLLDIGVLVLVHEFPEAYAKVLAELQKEPAQNVGRLEQDHLGISSLQAGEWLTERWNLPQFVVQAITVRSMPEAEAPRLPASQLIELILAWLIDPNEGQLSSLFEQSVLGQELSLSAEKWNKIEVDFMQQLGEIRQIAKFLAS